jgi:L-lysine 6-transaminase
MCSRSAAASTRLSAATSSTWFAACRQGELLLAELQRLAGEFPEMIINPRGRGLMCAFDAPDSLARDQLVKAFFQQKLLLVGCGERGIRFRPHLVVSDGEIQQAISIILQVLREGAFVDLPIHQDPCLLVGP